MYKYIQDSIKNNSRCVLKDLTKPQKKALSEIVRGLFTRGEPILRHIAQDETKSAKKQAEKQIRKRTIIAYDLTDISKSSAKKIEKLSKVWDGSKRKVTIGFSLHGVGINGILNKFQVHDSDEFTLNQVRRKIVTEISQKLGKKGIWVVDRGNDHKAFFKFLRQDLKVDFIARLKENRQIVLKETGVIIQVQNLKAGKYRIYLMNKNNNRVDMNCEYTLIISNHLEDKQTSLTTTELVGKFLRDFEQLTMYLQYPKGLVPLTSNIAENMNHQLKNRLRQMCGFQSIVSAENYLKLWCLKRRFQKFTDCKATHRSLDGKATLELAGCNIKNLDYLRL